MKASRSQNSELKAQLEIAEAKAAKLERRGTSNSYWHQKAARLRQELKTPEVKTHGKLD